MDISMLSLRFFIFRDILYSPTLTFIFCKKVPLLSDDRYKSKEACLAFLQKRLSEY